MKIKLVLLFSGLSVMLPAFAAAQNTSYGTLALGSNTNGTRNSAFGYRALRYNTLGSDNTAVGYNACNRATLGFSNTAVGSDALYWNTTGTFNTALGVRAGTSIQGDYNVAIGGAAIGADPATSTGDDNTAIGYEALHDLTAGSLNTAVGSRALNELTSGHENVAVGRLALRDTTSGHRNSALGTEALFQVTFGEDNAAIGYRAGRSITNQVNTISIGTGATASVSNQARIGNSEITSIGGYQPWSNVSDARFKVDVRENVPDLDFVMGLRPVTFRWDKEKLRAFEGNRSDETNQSTSTGDQAKQYTGFLAQEVEAAAESCAYDFSGVLKPGNEQSMYQLSYADFVVPLVKAVQEQQQKIAALESRLTSNAVAPVQGPFDSWWGRALALVAILWGATAVARALRGMRPQSWGPRPALVPAER